MIPWPQQVRALSESVAAIDRGVRRICVTSPTGTGKTKMEIDMLEFAAGRQWPAALYTNRRILLEQTKGVLESHNIFPGIRAAGHPRAMLRDVQLCMTQTEASQVIKGEQRELHPAKLVIVDELHNQTGPSMREILKRHQEQGAVIVGYTATPLDLGDLEVEELIVACTTSQGRECGALVPAFTYGPDEPDLKHIKNYTVGEDLSEGQNVKAIMRPGIFGRVYENWRAYNPEARPTILFAPGVKESIWFAEQFKAKGVKAAHIDGNDIWVEGEFYNSDPEARTQILAQVASGEIAVICNRFVLREGVDLPQLAHAIFATVFGSLTSYIQSGGRVLRAHPSIDHVVVQDHGGNWHRHGSLNSDREWEIGLTNHRVVSDRADRMREKKEHEPIVCPECSRVRNGGRSCPSCGHTAHVKSRMVVQVSGELKPMRGDIYRARRVKVQHDTAKKWERYYYGQKKSGRTFRQAAAWFAHEEHYWPPKDLPLMPVDAADWYRKIADVPLEKLIQRGGA